MTRHQPENTRRDQILQAARRCFIDNGYHPTRMDDIALASGLSKGGVYFHFKSKHEVFDSLVAEEFERSMGFLKSVREGNAPMMEKLQILGAHYMEYFNQAPDAPRFFIVMGEMGLRDPHLAERLLAMQNAFIDEIAHLIVQGIDEKVLRPVDPRTVAALLKALLDGIEGLNALRFPMDVQQFLNTGLELLMFGLVERS